MPRLTNYHYLQHRQMLIRLHCDHPDVFSYLSVRSQMDLHVYFQTWESRSDDELLTKRAELTDDDASLPQRAGRAFAELMNPSTQSSWQRARVTAGGHGIHVRGVVRPDPDAKQYARAILRLLEESERRDREDKNKAA